MTTTDYGVKSYYSTKTFVLGLTDLAIQGLLLAAVIVLFSGILYLLG